MPGGRKGLSRFSCINPELDSKSLTLSQPVLTDIQTACNISAHVRCPPSQLSLLSTWAVWLVFVYCHGYSGPRFSVEHTLRLRSIDAIARMSERRWRGLVGRCSHTMSRSPFFFAPFKHEAVLFTCIPQRVENKICLESILVRLIFSTMVDANKHKSHFSAEWWWALVWINLSSHKMKICQDSCNQIR